jgi:hypothetical protein
MFLFWLRFNDNNRHFTWRPTCISACKSDYVGDNQVTWGTPSRPHNHTGKSSVMTSITSQTDARHHNQAKLIDLKQLSHCWWCHCRRILLLLKKIVWTARNDIQLCTNKCVYKNLDSYTSHMRFNCNTA